MAVTAVTSGSPGSPGNLQVRRLPQPNKKPRESLTSEAFKGLVALQGLTLECRPRTENILQIKDLRKLPGGQCPREMDPGSGPPRPTSGILLRGDSLGLQPKRTRAVNSWADFEQAEEIFDFRVVASTHGVKVGLTLRLLGPAHDGRLRARACASPAGLG